MTHKVTLLINLGSPKSTSIKDVRAYLAEFLMDKYVIDIPWLFRALLIYGPILTFRPKKTAHAYKKIWTKEGSPLISISRATQAKLQKTTERPIYLAMRYGQPSIPSIIEKIIKEHPELETIQVISLYPHYASSSTLTAQRACEKALKKHKSTINLAFKTPFYNDPSYINNLVKGAKEQLETCDYLLFSYHGLPERHLRKADPTKKHCLESDTCCTKPSEAWSTCYRHQCTQTTALFMQILSKDIPHSIAYQSRLGSDPWLQPNTEDECRRLASTGVTNIHVICPSFVADCLETLEEIEMTGKDIFLENGGTSFTYIPCLNTQDDWIATLKSWL
jgi:protoporphyrin/coproporphyrin ferrochelatase